MKVSLQCVFKGFFGRKSNLYVLPPFIAPVGQRFIICAAVALTFCGEPAITDDDDHVGRFELNVALNCRRGGSFHLLVVQ